MTREEAINNLKDFIDTYITVHGEEDTIAVSLDNVDVEAFHVAIKALEQEPCEDAVSREAVLEQAYAYAYGNGLEPDGYCVNVEDIQALPPVTPTRQKGRWIPHRAKYDKTASVYECSICHKNNGFEKSKYCPHCGAEMEIKE